MANALPDAIGAQAAYPGRQVIQCRVTAVSRCSWGCHHAEARELPVKVIIFKNESLAFVELEQRRPASSSLQPTCRAQISRRSPKEPEYWD